MKVELKISNLPLGPVYVKFYSTDYEIKRFWVQPLLDGWAAQTQSFSYSWISVHVQAAAGCDGLGAEEWMPVCERKCKEVGW